MTALERQGEVSIGVTVEFDSAPLQFGNRLRSLVGKQLGCRAPAGIPAGPQRVFDVDGRFVVGADCRCKSTLGPVARAVAEGLSRDQGYASPPLGRPQGSVETGRPATDYSYVGFSLRAGQSGQATRDGLAADSKGRSLAESFAQLDQHPLRDTRDIRQIIDRAKTRAPLSVCDHPGRLSHRHAHGPKILEGR